MFSNKYDWFSFKLKEYTDYLDISLYILVHLSVCNDLFTNPVNQSLFHILILDFL